MAKIARDDSPTRSLDNSSAAHIKQQEATEIIELAIDDVEVLARAFDLIADVCAGIAERDADEIEDDPALLVH